MSQEVILFDGFDFSGAEHRHIFTSDHNLAFVRNDTLFPRSIAVVGAGATWRCFRGTEFTDPFPGVLLSQGLYPDASRVGINALIGSMQATGFPAASGGAPIEGHVILYAHPSLQFFDHRHVFRSKSLRGDFFSTETRSLVILEGNWRFFRDPDFQDPYPHVLGRGIYTVMENYGMETGKVLSMRPTPESPTIGGETVEGHLLLFLDPNLRGLHMHVFRSSPFVGGVFNDKASSMVIQERGGIWHFFKDADFRQPFEGVALGPGLYPWLPDVGIGNDSLSSLAEVAPPL